MADPALLKLLGTCRRLHADLARLIAAMERVEACPESLDAKVALIVLVRELTLSGGPWAELLGSDPTHN